ncbi:MAG: 3'-5' exonuclease [Verrucomicrobia bacterium]|nr:3'-5' exonuclease [Verrucomicrobiota bacterium]MBS0636037.1 3'-5' exonuclease [Verrucomicrobiota bacterium]
MLGIFLDQETTGLDSYQHKLLEIAIRVVDLSTGQHVAEYQSIICQPEEHWNKSDKGALQVNGFVWDDLSQGKSEKQVGAEIAALFQRLGIVRGKAVFICQNPSFDRAFFSHLIGCYEQEKMHWPYHWLDLASMYWALEMQKMREHEMALPEEIWLSKDHIAESFNLAKEQKPHRAMQGVDHLLLCYEKVVGFAIACKL